MSLFRNNNMVYTIKSSKFFSILLMFTCNIFRLYYTFASFVLNSEMNSILVFIGPFSSSFIYGSIFWQSYVYRIRVTWVWKIWCLLVRILLIGTCASYFFSLARYISDHFITFLTSASFGSTYVDFFLDFFKSVLCQEIYL